MPRWMIPVNKLDSEQRQFIDVEVKKQGNIWINGYPGSGKSVLLIHSVSDQLHGTSNVSICIVLFTHSLIQLFNTGIKELGLDRSKISVMTYQQFKKDDKKYDYIYCDEVQDLPKSVLQKMKSQSKKLILAGDSNQSIYDCDPSSKEPVAKTTEIVSTTSAGIWELNTIHRLTKSLIELVAKLLPSMENILSSRTNLTKKDTSVRLVRASSEKEEVEYIASMAKEAISADESVAIILPTHIDIIRFVNIFINSKGLQQWQVIEDKYGKPNFAQFNMHLKRLKVNFEYIGNGYGDLYNSGQIGNAILMTYHSSKGLDFDNVFLPFLSKNSIIRNKTLFMVGATRSKLLLTLSYSGEKHHFLNEIESYCTTIDLNKKSQNSSSAIDDFDF